MDPFVQLLIPFDVDFLEFKLEVKSKDGQKGQASTYVDPRRYMERLDQAFGVSGWSVEYKQLGDQAVIARLTITVDGQTVVREDVGEFGGGGKSQFPTATAQAFKRACASLGLGRYLYFLPKMWGAINQYNQFEEAEIARFKKMVPAPPTGKPQERPQATEASKPRSYPQGAESVNQAKAVARMGQLLAQGQEMGVTFTFVPENWRTLSYSELVSLGQRIANDIKGMKE